MSRGHSITYTPHQAYLTDLATHIQAQWNCVRRRVDLSRPAILGSSPRGPETPINGEHFQCEHSCEQVSENRVQ